MGFGIPGDDPEQSGGGGQLGKCVWSKCKLIRFTDQQLLVRHPSQILSLKCKIFLLGRVPALSPLYPVSQRSLLPGHLERKKSPDPIFAQMLNIYGNVLGWLTKANPPLPRQWKDVSNSGVLFTGSHPPFFTDWQRSFLSILSQHTRTPTVAINTKQTNNNNNKNVLI